MLFECNVLGNQMYFRAVATNIKYWLHKGLRLHPQKHPALDSLCLNLEGWHLMLQKDRSAPIDIQKTNCAVHFSSYLHSSSAQTITLFDRLSHFLHCHKCLASKRASLVMVHPVGLWTPSSPRSKSQVFGNRFVHCTCNTTGF